MTQVPTFNYAVQLGRRVLPKIAGVVCGNLENMTEDAKVARRAKKASKSFGSIYSKADTEHCQVER